MTDKNGLAAIAEIIVGLSYEEAKAKVSEAGGITRITRENGQGRIITMELRSDRVNVELDKNLVIRASVG
jgi:hypothetical protein